MVLLAIVLAVMFMLFCLALVGVRTARLGRVTLLDWSLLGMAGVYGAGWALVMYVTAEGGNPVWETWLLPNEEIYPLHTLSAFVLLGAIWMGWTLAGTLGVVRRIPSLPSDLREYRIRLALSAWVLLLMAFIAQWLYSQAYGGMIDLLQYSERIRSGNVPIANRWSFLKPFGGLAMMGSFVFFGLWLSRYRTIAVQTGLGLSTLFSLYILYSWLGRVVFLVYLMTFILGHSAVRYRQPYVLWMKGGLAMAGILVAAYFISVGLNLKPADNIIEFLARELSFPFGSFFAHWTSSEINYRWFYDLLLAPIFLLPSSLWSAWIENVSQVNTALIMGAPKGEAGVTRGIPVDLLTLGLLQASIPGMLLVGVVFGGLLRVIDGWLGFIADPGVRATFEAHVALRIAVLGVFYAQPAVFVGGNFDLWLGTLVVALLLSVPGFQLRRFSIR